MSGGERRLTRLTGGQRTALQIGGVLMMLAGAALFVTGPLRLFGVFGSVDPMADGAFADVAGSMALTFIQGVLGMFLFVLGGIAARFGFLKPVSEIVATETSGAVEHASGAVGRGFASAGIGGGGAAREVVKVRCRGCGYLDTDDARFCSSCGQAL